MNDIKLLFEPRSIAVVGASKDPKKIGHTVVKNILAGGYKGKVYPINPAGGDVLGLQAYPDISAIEGDSRRRLHNHPCEVRLRFGEKPAPTAASNTMSSSPRDFPRSAISNRAQNRRLRR